MRLSGTVEQALQLDDDQVRDTYEVRSYESRRTGFGTTVTLSLTQAGEARLLADLDYMACSPGAWDHPKHWAKACRDAAKRIREEARDG